MWFFGWGSRKLQRLFAREDHSRACLVGHKPIDPLATQLVLENNWPRVPVEQSGEASDMMRTGSLPARRRVELIRLAQRQGQSPWQNFPRSSQSADSLEQIDILVTDDFSNGSFRGVDPIPSDPV